MIQAFSSGNSLTLRTRLSKNGGMKSQPTTRIQFDSIRRHISEAILNEILATQPDLALTSQEIYNQLVEPPNLDMGDLAFGCFIVAKTLKKSPMMVAQELAQKLSPKISSDKVMAHVEAAGPYLNIRLQMTALWNEVILPAHQKSLFHQKLSQNNPKTMIEFSQPNTHKELHVGHMRNLCLGDSIVRMLRYAGHEIISSTFPGDVGTHVAKCMWYLKYHNQEAIPETGRGEWLGRIYSKAHLKLEDEVGTEKEAENRAQLTAILKQLEAHSGEYYDLWSSTREWSIELMKSVYHWAGVHFDHWYWESDVDADSVKLAHKLFKENKLIQSEGAVGMDLSDENLGFCMLLKSDGTGLYATKDIELARRKFEDFKIEKSIYVVDMRQALHFKQVFKVLERLGFEQAKNCFHLQYNFVELPDGAMSSRKGNIVPLTLLVKTMEETVRTNYLNRYADEWTEDEIHQTASIVAKGAIRFGMLRMDTNKKIVFDMNEWLKLEGESGPFIQYSYARIASLLRKFKLNDEFYFTPSLLAHASEKQLAVRLMNFNTCVLMAAENYKPAALCSYLYEIAKAFNVFYHDCPIGTAPSEELRQARLMLSAATGNVLQHGLGLLGIPVPERM